MAELTKRYVVMPLASEAPFDVKDPDGAFVLKPWKDPAALRVLETYRHNCYPALARALDAWLRAIKAGPRLRGGVGRRNEAFLKPEPPAWAAKPRARATPRAKITRKRRAKR
jgi:hypothetical protein